MGATVDSRLGQTRIEPLGPANVAGPCRVSASNVERSPRMLRIEIAAPKQRVSRTTPDPAIFEPSRARAFPPGETRPPARSRALWPSRRTPVHPCDERPSRRRTPSAASSRVRGQVRPGTAPSILCVSAEHQPVAGIRSDGLSLPRSSPFRRATRTLDPDIGLHENYVASPDGGC